MSSSIGQNPVPAQHTLKTSIMAKNTAVVKVAELQADTEATIDELHWSGSLHWTRGAYHKDPGNRNTL